MGNCEKLYSLMIDFKRNELWILFSKSVGTTTTIIISIIMCVEMAFLLKVLCACRSLRWASHLRLLCTNFLFFLFYLKWAFYLCREISLFIYLSYTCATFINKLFNRKNFHVLEACVLVCPLRNGRRRKIAMESSVLD